MAQIELIYSQQSSDFVKGRAYSNPRFYSTPRSGVSKVFIVGDWPKIQADYGALGIPVERLDAAPVADAAPIGPALTAVADPSSVVIPDDWRDLHWQKIRALAKDISNTAVKNGDEAIAIVEAELARREAAQQPPAETAE